MKYWPLDNFEEFDNIVEFKVHRLTVYSPDLERLIGDFTLFLWLLQPSYPVLKCSAGL